jgi:hypothetical protein
MEHTTKLARQHAIDAARRTILSYLAAKTASLAKYDAQLLPVRAFMQIVMMGDARTNAGSDYTGGLRTAELVLFKAQNTRDPFLKLVDVIELTDYEINVIKPHWDDER